MISDFADKIAFLNYGNHGEEPAQLQDYYEYLREAFFAAGYHLLLSQKPVAGALNLLIECFDDKFTELLKETKADSGTRYIVLVTEFITGETFNKFEYEPAQVEVTAGKAALGRVRSWAKASVTFVLSQNLRTALIHLFPKLYPFLRRNYFRLFGYPFSCNEKMVGIYKLRYDNFLAIEPLCEAIWCVTSHQLPGFQKKFGARVRLMPLVSWTPKRKNTEIGILPQDIDFLFTGSLTPYRAAVLEKLRKRGYKVVVGTTFWPQFVRDHYLARAKVALQILQAPNWPYPSVMRYHYLLTSGVTTVAEKGRESCFQERFLFTASSEEFIGECERVVKLDNLSAAACDAGEDYFRASETGQQEFRNLLGDRRAVSAGANARLEL